MARQLNLDRDKLDHCYQLAGLIVSQAAKYIDRHSSSSIEAATLLAMGVEGELRGRSLASWLVESLTKDQLRLGSAAWWGRALLAVKEEPKRLAEQLIKKKIQWEALPEVSMAEIKKETKRQASQTLEGWKKSVASAPSFKIKFSPGHPFLGIRPVESKPRPLFARKKQIPSIPHSLSVLPLEEGKPLFGNLKKEELVAALEGLHLPEQIFSALPFGVKAFQADGWFPIFNGSMAKERALTDFYFSLSFCAGWPIHFLSRHAFLDLKPDQLFASHLLYEQMAKRAGVSLENLILSFSLPEKGISFIDQIALSQLLREAFPQSFLWCRMVAPADALSLWGATFTEADVIEGAGLEQIHETMGVQNEFLLNTHGKVARQAHQMLDQTWRLLKKISDIGFWKLPEKNGLFPPSGGGMGKEGVFQKSYHYWNPLCQVLASS